MQISVICILLASIQSFSSTEDANEDELKSVHNVYKNGPQDEPGESDIDLSPAINNDIDPGCLLENNKRGKCVMYYLCDATSRTLITDGSTLIDTRQSDSSCLQYLDVCCDAINIRDVNSRDAESSTSEQTVLDKLPASTSLALSPISILKPATAVANRPVVLTKEITCGWSNPLTYIFPPVNKTEDRLYADFGEFPWMVAVILLVSLHSFVR